jgi:hypothetical protein
MTELRTVHDPRGYPPSVVGKRLAQRPESLDDKTLYLLSVHPTRSHTATVRYHQSRKIAPIETPNGGHRFVADSPLEGGGFELPVRRRAGRALARLRV